MSRITIDRITPESGNHLTVALQHVLKTSFIDTFGHNYPPQDLAAYADSHLTVQAVTDELHCPDNHFFGLWCEDELAGMSKLVIPGVKYIPAGVKANNPVYFERLYFLSPYQGQGLADVLMTFTMQYAKRQYKADFVYLSVWENNIKAQRFYQNAGFRPYSRIQYPVGNTLDNEYVMGTWL